jgi:protein export-related membrane protein
VTSVITLLPILALFIFGGATLKDFAFAIMVGISVGAVSTIFIATPLLTGLLERDPQFASRKDVPMDDEIRRRILHDAEVSASEEPTPSTPIDELEHVIEGAVEGGDGDLDDELDGVGEDEDESQDAKRERRRQRRRARPHGRR